MSDKPIDLSVNKLSGTKSAESIPAALAAPKRQRKVTKPAVSTEPVVPATADIAAAAIVVPPAEAPVEISEAKVAAPEAAPVSEPEISDTPTSEIGADAPVSPPAAASAEPQQEQDTVATTVENVKNMGDTMKNEAEKMGETTKNAAQAMFADAKERTEDAVAKSQKLFADMADFNKGNIEALVESGRVAARGFEQMGREAAEEARKSFEATQAAVKTLAQVKSPTEFMRLQGEFARTAFDQAVAQASRNTESMLKLAGEIAQPISNRMALAADKMKAAA